MALTTQPPGRHGLPGDEPVVLVIESNEEHQILSTMALGRQGFRVIVAGSGREGLGIALSQRLSAIVLDFKIRDLPALEVLEVLAKRVPEVPKIFVVASGQESTAVRALASGASGYLVKTARYNELLPSEVETQIRAAAARKSLKEQRQALGESEERFQKAFRASPVAIALTTGPGSRFIDVNEAFLRLIGYAREEVIGHTAEELDYLKEDERLAQLRATFDETGSAREAEIELRTRSGETRTVRTSLDTVVIEGAPCVLSLLRDVTDERQNDLLRASLYDIIDATESSSDLPDLYRRIHAIIAKLMPAQNCYIALYDPLSDEVSFPYFVDEKEPAPAPYRAGKGLTEYVLRSGAPLLVSPSTLAELVESGKVQEVGAEGIDWLGVPLNVGGRTIGVLAVQSYAEPTRYTEREKEILSLVSSQVAMAIDRRAAQDALRRAESRFRTVFHDAPMGILLIGRDGRIVQANPACLKMLGYSPTELAGKHLREITDPEDAEETLRRFDELVQGVRTGFLLEKRYLRKDGSSMWTRVTATMLRSPDGSPPAAMAMIQDVTEERRAREERETHNRRFSAMIEHISDGINLVDRDGTLTWQSPSAYRMFGFSPEEVLGRSGFEFIHPDDVKTLLPMFDELVANPGKSITAEFRLKLKDGTWRWVEAVATNLLSDPDLQSIVMNYRDITDRYEALERIRFQANLLSQVSNAVIAVDDEMRIIYWNDAATKMCGWTAKEVMGKHVHEIVATPESTADAAPTLRELWERGHWEAERDMIHKDGSRVPAALSLTVLRDRNEKAVGYVGVASDIRERVVAQRELVVRARQQAAIAALGQKALIEPLLSTLMNDVVETVAHTLEVEFTSVLERLPEQRALSLKARFGWDLPVGTQLPEEPRASMMGHALSADVPVVMEQAEQEDRFEVRDLFLGRGIVSGLCVVVPGPSGPYGVLCAHSKRARRFSQDDVHFCESIANVIANAHERARIEKILGENERMASMGQLAEYLAHEVNTPLTNISLLASSIARRETNPEILEKIAAIREQRRRASAIVMDILEFPHERSPHRTPEDLRKVIAAAVEQLAPYQRPGVELIVETGDHAAFANVDVIQIRDVLSNLIKNAFEATPKGRVTLTLGELPDFLMVSVTDTGTGIASDALECLLHPASPRTPAAGGRGLGLAVCRSIVAAHGGRIEASSEIGKGSTFTVVLPRFEAH